MAGENYWTLEGELQTRAFKAAGVTPPPDLRAVLSGEGIMSPEELAARQQSVTINKGKNQPDEVKRQIEEEREAAVKRCLAEMRPQLAMFISIAKGYVRDPSVSQADRNAFLEIFSQFLEVDFMPHAMVVAAVPAMSQAEIDAMKKVGGTDWFCNFVQWFMAEEDRWRKAQYS